MNSRNLLIKGQIVADRFKVIELLSGAFIGSVYKAVDANTGRLIASLLKCRKDKYGHRHNPNLNYAGRPE